MSDIDEMAPFKRSPKFPVSQTTPQDDALHLVLISHFETAIERAFVGHAVTQYHCDCITHTIVASCGIVDFLKVHVDYPVRNERDSSQSPSMRWTPRSSPRAS